MDYTPLLDMVEKPTWKTLLTEIVEKHKMNPWDLDIAELTHAYVQRISEMRKLDFRVPANAVLATAILLRFKSDNWELYPQEQVEEELENSSDWEFVLEGKRVPELNPARRITRRKVTIDELIKAVDDVMRKERTRAERRSFEHIVPEQLMDLAFENAEDFQELIDSTFDRVVEALDSQKLAVFSDIVRDQTRSEVVFTLVSLLHLATQNKILMWQDEAFREIFISMPEGGQ